VRSAAVTTARSRASCSALSSPNRFGSARKIAKINTIATNAIFQRGYEIMRS
jgi:hypothetical protein